MEGCDVMSIEKKLLKYKQMIAEHKEEKSKAEGSMKTLMDNLQEEFSCSTVKEGEELLIGDAFAEYRTFPQEMFRERTFYAYGDRLAFLSLTKETAKIRILKKSEFSESFRILFNIAWDQVATPL